MITAALETRARLERGEHDRAAFRCTLDGVAATDRDAWLDLALGLDTPPEDGAELPRGCVPYLPCPVNTLLHAVDQAAVDEADVFVDVGSGVGRAMTLVHLLTGAATVGLEVQTELVRAARALSRRLRLERVTTLAGDASVLVSRVTNGSVFFFYCPFSGRRLSRIWTCLEVLERARPLRVCCVDLPSPDCAWLAAEPVMCASLRVYRDAVSEKTGANPTKRA